MSELPFAQTSIHLYHSVLALIPLKFTQVFHDSIALCFHGTIYLDGMLHGKNYGKEDSCKSSLSTWPLGRWMTDGVGAPVSTLQVGIVTATKDQHVYNTNMPTYRHLRSAVHLRAINSQEFARTRSPSVHHVVDLLGGCMDKLVRSIGTSQGIQRVSK